MRQCEVSETVCQEACGICWFHKWIEETVPLKTGCTWDMGPEDYKKEVFALVEDVNGNILRVFPTSIRFLDNPEKGSISEMLSEEDRLAVEQAVERYFDGELLDDDEWTMVLFDMDRKGW